MSNKRLTEIEIALSIVFIFIGGILLFVPYESLKTILCIVLGLYIVISNIPTCIYCFMLSSSDKSYLPYASASLVAVLFGLLFLLWPNIVVTYILAVILIVLPVVRIFISSNRKEQLKKEVPLIIIGALLCFTPFAAVIEIIVKIFGGIICLYGIVNIIITIKHLKNDNNNNSHNDFSDNKPKDYIDVDVKEV